jgi:small subunit ribosomal protein S20
MPNTKSAKKALRSSIRKNKFNLVKKFKVRNSLKQFRKSLTEEANKSSEALSKVFSAIDKAVKTNLIHKNTAARKKSRLSKLLVKSN